MNWRLNLILKKLLLLDASEKFLSLIHFVKDTQKLYNRLKASRLARFLKTRKHVNQGKTQCWALFVISKATFTKTAIKPKFVDRFSVKKFSAKIAQEANGCLLWFLYLHNVASGLEKPLPWSRRRVALEQQTKYGSSELRLEGRDTGSTCLSFIIEFDKNLLTGDI